MSKVDDELSRRFHRAERTVDGGGLFDGLARRRDSRRTLKRVQAGALAVAVVVATAGGFIALQRAFDEGADPPDRIGGSLAGNGEIVFSAEGGDGFVHLYAARPDGSGRRALTDFGSDDTDADVSPDGRAVVFAHRLERSDPVVATIAMDGGPPTWLTDPTPAVRDPAWSPSGTKVAFIGDPSGPWLSIVDAGGGRPTTTVFSDAGPEAAHPAWSPDGTWLVFAARNLDRTDGGWDIATVRPDGSGLSRIVVGDVDDQAPAWSPDGRRIAFMRTGEAGDEVWTVAPDGSDEILIATAVEASLQRELSWAPDGSSLLVSDGDWIYAIDPSPDGDPRDNFVQLLRGFSPSWQPIPIGSEPSVAISPEPSASPGPESEARDVGFGFPVCEMSDVSAQFDGEGTSDTAFVATRVGNDGGCPSHVEGAEAYVGIDVDQDGRVDSSYGPVTCEVWFCRAFAAPDLDGHDGRRELLVAESRGSVVGLGVFAFRLDEGSPRNVAVVRILIGEPELPQTGFETGEPARFLLGGDEGWSYRLRCEDHGQNRFIYQQRAFRPVDGTGPATVDETTLIYIEGRLDVFDAREPEPSTRDDPLGPQPEEVCGAGLPAI